jgi:hypothetical protein
MVLISNGGTINIKNHYKIKCNEKKNENFNYSHQINKIITNKYHGLLEDKYHGLLEDKYIYEGSDDESKSDEAEAAKPVSKSKKK